MLREKRGWSQGKLAAMIPGVRQQSIDQLEQGKVARPRFLPALAQVLGIREQWLLTGKGKAASAKAKKMAEDLDSELLCDVIAAVERTLRERGMRLDNAHKARIVGALYTLMLNEPGNTDSKLEAAAENIIGYEKLRQRSKE
jgi:transcriptional regulator with XRE-family HTH domain